MDGDWRLIYMSSIRELAFAKAIGGGGGGGGDISVESLSVTANGQYSAPRGKAYTPVNVNVPQIAVESLNVTENGTYEAQTGKAYSPISVNVQPTLQSKTVTENGTVTADAGYDGLSSVTVNVSGGGGLPLGIAEGGYTLNDLGLSWDNTAEEDVA